MFGSLYEQASSNYDGIIERMIGLSIPLELKSIQMQAAQKLASMPESKFNTAMFELVLSFNKEILVKLEALCKSSVSCGTQNMLAGLADQLEVENYKLKQRVRK
jgi:DNA-binding ferritin-like protein